jgi:hypothetical protein
MAYSPILKMEAVAKKSTLLVSSKGLGVKTVKTN